MSIAPLPRPLLVSLFLLIAAALLGGTAGCRSVRSAIAGSDTRPRMESQRERPRKALDKRMRRMVVAVTTDASGQVADVRFVQSSGKPAVDDYVREDIRASFPGQGQPGTVTTMELNYSAAEGFSEPRILATTPLQP